MYELTFIETIIYSLYVSLGSIIILLSVKLLQDENKNVINIKFPIAIISFLIAIGITILYKNFSILNSLIFIYIFLYICSLFLGDNLKKFIMSLGALSFSFINISQNANSYLQEFFLIIIYFSILIFFLHKIKEKTFSNILYFLSYFLLLLTSIQLNNTILITSFFLIFISESLLLAEYNIEVENDQYYQFKPYYFSASISSLGLLIIPFSILIM